MTSSADTVLAELDQLVETYTELYKDLHRNPELSMQETQTAERIQEELEKLDLEVRTVGETGRIAVIENGEGPVVLARADIDALPMSEQTGLDYSSEVDGAMHACGHDMHASSLLGAVAALNAHRDAWSGTYIALFQPGEETASGAQAMVDDGLTDAIPAPDIALGQHIGPGPAGFIGYRTGPVMSAGQSLKVTVHGSGAHGSSPHESVDPVVLASTIVLRLQTIVSRELAPGTFAVVTVGSIQAGTKSNIIPDRAQLLINTRVYDEDVQDQINDAIQRIVTAECQAAGSPRDPEFEYYDVFPLTDNDAEHTERVVESFVEHFGDDRVVNIAPATASEDFSILPDAFDAPYVYWFVTATPQDVVDEVEQSGGEKSLPGNHSPFFYPEIDPTLRTGIQAQVVAALSYLDATHPQGNDEG